MTRRRFALIVLAVALIAAAIHQLFTDWRLDND